MKRSLVEILRDERLSPAKLPGRNLEEKVEPGVHAALLQKLSARKNLFLETGWYRPKYLGFQ